MKSPFQYKEEEALVELPNIREPTPRPIYIKKDDVSENECGRTSGCRGCEAASLGLVGNSQLVLQS